MSRIYTAVTSIDSDTKSIRLIKADNPAQARTFVTRDSITVKYAEQEEIADLVACGTKVEDATNPNAAQPTLPGV